MELAATCLVQLLSPLEVGWSAGTFLFERILELASVLAKASRLVEDLNRLDEIFLKCKEDTVTLSSGCPY